jgi:hypothetical protein
MSPARPSESVPESVSLGDRDDQRTQVAVVDRHTAQPAQIVPGGPAVKRRCAPGHARAHGRDPRCRTAAGTAADWLMRKARRYATHCTQPVAPFFHW